jgi:hypothetical protein
MKTIGKFTQLNHDFIVKVVKMETNSNYNLFCHVFHDGEKMALVGMTFKENTPKDEIIEWAKKAVGYMQTKEFVNDLFEDVKSKPQTAEEKYPELDIIADKIANATLYACNTQTEGVKSEMPYKAQCVLEMVIEKLKRQV